MDDGPFSWTALALSVSDDCLIFPLATVNKPIPIRHGSKVMKNSKFRARLLGGACVGMLGVIATAFSFEAMASTVCSVGTAGTPQTFSCVDDSTTPATVASGTFSADATFVSDGSSPLEITSTTALDVTLNGQINAPEGPAGYIWEGISLSSAGPLTYQSNGTVTGWTAGVLYATYLHSNLSITANTGAVLADGVRVTGVFAETQNGDISVAGGNTTVSGYLSRGLWVYALNGASFVDTGTVTATGDLSRAVLAHSLPTQGYCDGPLSDLSVTVNATGDLTADLVAITTLTCGSSLINVEAGKTVAVTGTSGMAILAIANTTAETIIDGQVLAASAADRALDIRGYASSTTTIGESGFMSGTFDGEEAEDSITLSAGGTWASAGISDFKGGSDQLVNFGTIVTSGNTHFSGLEMFDNSGAINMASGSVGDTFELAGDYVGLGNASLYIDATDTGADQLIIGGHASGTTSLYVNTGVLIPDPVLVVDTASSSPAAFVLGNTSATPLIDLHLTQSGDDYFVTAVPSGTAQQTMKIAGDSQRRWMESANNLLNGSALKRPRNGRDRRTPFGFWMRSYAGGGEYGANFGNHLTGGRMGAQAGFDYYIADNVLIGVTGGYDGREANLSTKIGGLHSNDSNVGAYVQYVGASGLYVGLLAKADRSDLRLTHRAFVGAKGDPDSKTIGAEAEAGFKTTAMGVSLDANGGLTYLRSQTADFTVDGMGFDFGNAESLRGRLGIRAEFNGKLGLFAEAEVNHEFEGNSELTVRTGAQNYTIEADVRNTWARFEAGFGSQGELGPVLSAWAELGAGKSLGMKAGLRF